MDRGDVVTDGDYSQSHNTGINPVSMFAQANQALHLFEAELVSNSFRKHSAPYFHPHTFPCYNTIDGSATVDNDTAIRYLKQNSLDCFNDQLTSEHRHIFLDFHNAVRRRVAKGLQTNVDEFLPTASNMYRMKWSCLLENEIHERLSRCQSYKKKMKGFNMNIHEFSDFTPGYTPDLEFEETLSEWWSVMEEFKVAEPRTIETAERFQKVANMLSPSTIHIGCSFAFCEKVLYIGCMYHPNGTTQAGILYKTGPFCIHDSDCTTYRHSRCSDGLCIKGMAGRDVLYG